MPAYDQIGEKNPTFAKTRQLKINKLVTRTLSHQELYDWQYKVPIGSDPKNCLFIIMSISWGKKFACEF